MMLSSPYRADFPIFNDLGSDHVYLDSAATSHKPYPVIEAVGDFYRRQNANPHRGIYALAHQATEAYEEARKKVQAYIHASQAEEVIFTRGTTQSLNWLARSFADSVMEAGEEILISPLEHHANIIPWQEMARKKGYRLTYLPFKASGIYSPEDIQAAMTDKTRILSITHVSNVTGTIQPIQAIAQVVHERGAYVIVDGAQGIVHQPVDVQALDCDFYCFSGHKIYGPTGIGVLYGKAALLEAMEPVEYGGEMIRQVQAFESTWADLPYKFEGGTQNIAGAIGLAAALDWIQAQGGMQALQAYEDQLSRYAYKALRDIPQLYLHGDTDMAQRVGVFSFEVEGIHPHDLATLLDAHQVAIRTGHHCAQPLMRSLGVPATNRASLACYNDSQDIDRLVQAIYKAKEYFTIG